MSYVFGYMIALMSEERKNRRINARVPDALLARVDFVVRNLDSTAVKNRSTAFLAAIEAWLLTQEEQLEKLGISSKKAR